MYLFIDTDPGLDDALALLYILTKTTYEVVGLSSVSGNVNIDLTTKNLQLIAGIINKKFNKNIPVFKGISKPIVQVQYNDDIMIYHGCDGLGNFWSSEYATNNAAEINGYLDCCELSDKSAVFALIELSKQYAGELVIIGLGPLGNIALAQIIDPDFGSRVKEVFIMGGDISGRGNSLFYMTSEFNFSVDPEAAYVVFKEMKCRKTIMPLETVFELNISPELSQGWLKNLASKTDIISAIKNYVIHFRSKNGKPFRLCDLILAMLFIEPELITKTLTVNATIELNGRFTRGKVVMDFFEKSKINNLVGFSEVNIVQSTNCDAIFQIYESFFA